MRISADQKQGKNCSTCARFKPIPDDPHWIGRCTGRWAVETDDGKASKGMMAGTSICSDGWSRVPNHVLAWEKAL
jgi:hypothetical protein